MPEHQLELDFSVDWEPQPELLGLLTPDDIYRRAEVLIDQIKEDRRIERKPTCVHGKDLGEYFSMWANTSPAGGVIVWGMADGGSIDGCESVETERVNKMENAGYDYAPGCYYDCKRVAAIRDDGARDWVLIFRVKYHETRVITTADRRVFVRRGDRKVELKSDEERQQLRIDKGEVQFEQEPCALSFPGDFDKTLIHQLTASVRKLRRLNDDTSDLKILCALRLGKLTGQIFTPNVACALLLAADPVAVIPGCKIHFLRFEGAEEKRGPEYNEVANIPPIEGPLPNQINAVNQVLEQRIRRFSGFGKDGRFHTTPEYPQGAWNEAIVNACVHRSYNFRNMKIFVRMFDDRLEIESPGPFPPGVNPATIYDVQHSRNPYLMEAMRYMGYVKEIGEGVPRIREEMLKLELPAPEFSQQEVSGTMVRVVLRNNISLRRRWVDSDVARLLGEQIVNRLNEREKIIVNYIIVHDSINVSQAQRLTEHNWHTSKKLLDRLVEKEVLRYVRKSGKKVDRQAYYVLRQ